MYTLYYCHQFHQLIVSKLIHHKALLEKYFGTYQTQCLEPASFLFFHLLALSTFLNTQEASQTSPFPSPWLPVFSLSFWSTLTSRTLLNKSLSHLSSSITAKYSANCFPVHSVKGRSLQTTSNKENQPSGLLSYDLSKISNNRQLICHLKHHVLTIFVIEYIKSYGNTSLVVYPILSTHFVMLKMNFR